MLSQLIQRQVPIGSRVTFSLKSGSEISGVLIEIGRDHVTVESNGSSATILLEMVGAWQVLEELSEAGEKIAKVRISDGRDAPIDQPASQLAEIQVESTLPSAVPEPEVLKRLLEIETRFQAQLQTARIELRPPDFTFPAEELKTKKTDALTIWSRIKDKYEYATKINELSAKFGRIQPIVNDLKTLANWFPTSTSVKRHLAYLYWLSGNRQEAIQCYKDAALISEDAWDWYNVAVLALKDGQEELACYSLEQFFHRISVVKALDAWYIYVGLLKKCANYPALGTLSEIKDNGLSEEEQRVFLETGIYLSKVTGREQTATKLVQKWLEGQPLKPLALEAFGQLGGQPSDTYQRMASELMTAKDSRKKKQPKETPHQPQGHIYQYLPARNFGFLRGVDEAEYFFHRSAVVDDELFDKIRNLRPGERIPVVFETAQGPKGPIAIGVSLYRTIDETFELASSYANDGEYPKAIAQIKKVLDLNPEYPAVQESYEKWREYARISGVPKGSNPYARAKRVQLIEKDLDRAAQLLRIAISQGDNTESAVKDLAGLLAQQGKPQEAIDILLKNRKQIQDRRSVDNMLIGFYQNAGQYDQAIDLLQRKLERASNEGRKAQVLWQIASSYLRQEDYTQAERHFRTVLRSQPDNKAAQRNVAICLFKQERYDDAEKILNRILDTSPDVQAAELLEAITQAKATGQLARIDEIIIETTLSDFSGEIGGLTMFFLGHCDFKGISPDRIKENEQGERVYIGSRKDARYDLERLEDVARQLGTRRPSERADYYLTAARMEEKEDPNQFYRYLCRSFASRGDAFVIENKPLAAARELYCEALNIYDGYRNPSKGEDRYDEQDAVNAVIRFLYSYLGRDSVPTLPPKRDEHEPVLKQQLQYIDNAIEEVVTEHPQREKFFDAIAYLVLRSRYAASRILHHFYDQEYSLRPMALEYLKTKGISASGPIKGLDDFVHLWNELRRKNLDEIRSISNEFRLLARIELTTASLENIIERAKGLGHRLFFDLDQQRVTQLQKVLETALDLCKQDPFEEQERLCIQIDSRCQDLMREIEASPTKLSVEEMYSVIETIQKKVNARLEELYQSSTPQLSLRLPVESYTPDNNQQIEVQIVVANRMGCSPAETLELIVQEDEDLFVLSKPEIKLDSSLRGGDHYQEILKVPLRLGEQALRSQTFSLPVYAQYRTRSEEIIPTSVHNFSIRLYSEEEFEEIENPYAAYTEGGVVGDPEMFYGRGELIENAARAIQESRTQSKGLVIFGQKRAGKSSILHHLKTRLQAGNDLLVLDLGNIGSILDGNSSSPFLYQILWSILKKLEYAIEDRVNEGSNPLGLSFPTDREFYKHPSPLVFFKDIFDRYKRIASKLEDWRGVRLVLLIDEFSYIYGQIVAGHIPELFMKNWKALLQENYFSAVLAGQDVMPKFKQRFPNEFGTIQDERVSYLRREDAIQLIDEPIRIGGRQGESRYRERAIERILTLTAGSPFYIQIICNRLVEYMNRKRARLVTEADVGQVKNELVRGVNALGLDKFENLINSGDTSEDAISDEDALKVLTTIAVNSQTGPCSRNNIACETHTPVDAVLDDLVKREVVERERAQYYSIRVGLFKEWLIAHQ